jgi:hypothetical protein
VQLVGDADVERPRLRAGQLSQVFLLAGLPAALPAAEVVLGLQRVPGDGEDHGPELVADLPLEHRTTVRRGLLQHVVEDAGYDGQLLAAVAREDDGDVGRVGKIIHPGPSRRGGSVVLGGEGERVIDAVGITVHERGAEGSRAAGPGCPAITECREAYAFAG